ncbi:MAG: hypothetical protein HC921_10700 [Synechococcaceae cyanobacterium SM2_3_1]|nr:hypothetical protein [Synechococcaceae cyanobacterium SM2_3_1]
MSQIPNITRGDRAIKNGVIILRLLLQSNQFRRQLSKATGKIIIFSFDNQEGCVTTDQVD